MHIFLRTSGLLLALDGGNRFGKQTTVHQADSVYIRLTASTSGDGVYIRLTASTSG